MSTEFALQVEHTDMKTRKAYIMKKLQSLIVAILVALLGVSGFGPVMAVAQSSTSRSSDAVEMFDCAILSGLDCGHVIDAQKWANKVTKWKFPNHGGHNDMADAFRHCTWMGALATRIGSNEAYTIGFIHEDAGDRRGQPRAEREMDEWNNFIGAGIGHDAVQSGTNDTWGYVLQECESRARNYELYGLNGVKGGYED